jgi:predicted CoA-binding protein
VYDTNTGDQGKILRLKMATKKTLVLGASENPARYSNMAIRRLRAHRHPVVAIGRKKGKVLDTPIDTEKEAVADIDTITLYLNPTNQQPYYDYILSLHPRRIIFNPGAENDELAALAEQKGIIVEEACTLVMLNTGQY